MMKNYFILLLPLFTIACSYNQPTTQPTLDMKTVEEYHKQVMTGHNNAIPALQNDDISLNSSDYRLKTTPTNIAPPQNQAIWHSLPKPQHQIYNTSHGSTQSNTVTDKTTEILKDTPNEKQTRSVEKSETKWNSKGFSLGL
jgi:hypothetical protein